jgi:hypothetical protein
VHAEILYPWRGGCPHRERALRWVAARATYPYRVCHAPDGPWCKAAAVMPAVRESVADIVVIHDADVWTPGVEAAVERVAAGAAWAIPHRGVWRLDRDATTMVLAGHQPHQGLALTERAYPGMIGGGVFAIRRDLLEDVPMDGRFTGWGQEDAAHGVALWTLLGAPWRGNAPLYHLWHPPQDRMSRRYGNPAGRALWDRYRSANADPRAMRALISECS